jgi:hypothetical protein
MTTTGPIARDGRSHHCWTLQAKPATLLQNNALGIVTRIRQQTTRIAVMDRNSGLHRGIIVPVCESNALSAAVFP